MQDIDEMEDVRQLRERVSELEQVNARLQGSKEKFEMLFEYAPDGYYLSDLKGTFINGNKAAEAITGYRREELIGKSFLKLKLLSAKQLPIAAGLLAKNALGKSTGPDELTLKRKDGSTVPIEIRTHPVRIGEQRLVLGIARDISARRHAEAALYESEERFRDLFENAHDIIQSVGPDGHFQYVNRAWLATLGYTRNDVAKLTLWDVVHPDSHDHCREVFQAVLSGRETDHVEATFVSKDNKKILVEGNISCRFKEGKAVATRGIFRDVTQRKEYEERLAALARHDSLTGVYNRHALTELVDREVERSNRYNHPIGVLLIDVNRFKEVNDRFGHAMGDKVLQAVATILQHNVRNSDIVVRYGGDEFLIILPETNGETDLVKERILAEVAHRNETNPLLEFPVTLAIGSVHWSPDSDQSMEQVFAEADKLMYEDKRNSSATQT